MLSEINNKEDIFEGLSTWKIAIPHNFMEVIKYSKENNLDILTIEWYRELIKKWISENEIKFIIKMRALSEKVYSKIDKLLSKDFISLWEKDKWDKL